MYFISESVSMDSNADNRDQEMFPCISVFPPISQDDAVKEMSDTNQDQGVVFVNPMVTTENAL